MLLAALLLFLLAGPSAAQTNAAVSCDSEAELLGSLTWVRDACSQAGEQFDDDDTLVPGAVTTRGCAEVVRRVASDCGGLLARSPWFASRRAALDAADAAASALTMDGGGVGTDAALHLADPGLRFVHSCGAVLDELGADTTAGSPRCATNFSGLSRSAQSPAPHRSSCATNVAGGQMRRSELAAAGSCRRDIPAQIGGVAPPV